MVKSSEAGEDRDVVKLNGEESSTKDSELVSVKPCPVSREERKSGLRYWLIFIFRLVEEARRVKYSKFRKHLDRFFSDSAGGSNTGLKIRKVL